MKVQFDPIQYKKITKTNWNATAPDYHYNWAEKQIGPFRSTKELVREAHIQPTDSVLDLACGTGVVSKEVSQYLDNDASLVGIDLSRTALTIARKSVQYSNATFLEMDAENMGFNFMFDKVLCQYGLMFFPNVKKVLNSIKQIMRSNAKLVLAVHGLPDKVPYFSSVMGPILKYIPDIRPEGTPTVHRFGNPNDLQDELLCAGFSDVLIKQYNFSYNAGTFEEYWQDYMHSTANLIKPKIESQGADVVSTIKKESQKNASRYIKNGSIMFPWRVLLASASNSPRF